MTGISQTQENDSLYLSTSHQRGQLTAMDSGQQMFSPLNKKNTSIYSSK